MDKAQKSHYKKYRNGATALIFAGIATALLPTAYNLSKGFSITEEESMEPLINSSLLGTLIGVLLVGVGIVLWISLFVLKRRGKIE